MRVEVLLGTLQSRIHPCQSSVGMGGLVSLVVGSAGDGGDCVVAAQLMAICRDRLASPAPQAARVRVPQPVVGTLTEKYSVRPLFVLSYDQCYMMKKSSSPASACSAPIPAHLGPSTSLYVKGCTMITTSKWFVLRRVCVLEYLCMVLYMSRF